MGEEEGDDLNVRACVALSSVSAMVRSSVT